MIILYSLSLMSLIAITLFIPWQKGGYNIMLKGREADTISKGRVVIACVGGGGRLIVYILIVDYYC